MRAIGMLSLAGLILTGLPPAPIAPATGAAQRAERGRFAARIPTRAARPSSGASPAE